MEKKRLCRNDAGNYLALAVCFLLMMVITSCFTSPLFPNNLGYDSAIFTLLGKGILRGKMLYVDLFDHKGPVIFYIDALGLALGGRNGIFLLQCIFGLVNLALLYQMGKMLRPEKKFASVWECLFLFIIGYAMFFYTFQRGNHTEEYSLPFISACLLLFVKYGLRAEYDPVHPPKYAVAYGVGLAIMAFLRLNNGATIGAGILAVAIYLIYRKEFSNLMWNLLAGLLGMALVTIPILLYYYTNDALDEMIYATFLHNFQIAGNTAHFAFSEKPFVFVILYTPMILCAVLMLYRIYKTKKVCFMDVLLAVILLVNGVALWIANRYLHYFTLFIPVYIVFLCRYLPINGKKLSVWVAVVCALFHLMFVGYYTLQSANFVYISKIVTDQYAAAAEGFGRIPEEERDSVIGYNVGSADYLAGDIVPCYKYYTLQPTWAITNPNVIPDFMRFVEEEKPLWVVTLPYEDTPELLRILEAHYELQFANEYLEYYRVKQ